MSFFWLRAVLFVCLPDRVFSVPSGNVVLDRRQSQGTVPNGYTVQQIPKKCALFHGFFQSMGAAKVGETLLTGAVAGWNGNRFIHIQ